MRSSDTVRDMYDTAYYLGACGGFREYALFGGRKLEDPRLAAVHALAAAGPGTRVLDVGCGRGELAYAFASAGAQVTGVDYSTDALALARATAGDVPVRFVCADVTRFADESRFDVAVASDVIEHLSHGELDELYARVTALLAPDGTFVLHTWPSKWMYRYGYERRRRAAALLGHLLDGDPRTPYERAMHINEQRPNVLRRQLRGWFPHAEVWLGNATDPRGSLAEPLRIAAVRDASDIFAVASHRPIDTAALLARITTPPLPDLGGAVELSEPDAPRSVRAGEPFAAAVTLCNDSPFALSSFFPHPVRFADRWLDAAGRVVADTRRSLVAPAAAPGTRARYRVRCVAPAQPGRYVLRLSLVQELVRWFATHADVTVDVVA